MSVSASGVNITEEGPYLVSYYVSGSTTANELVTSLYLNGSAITDETLEQSANAGAASKTIILLLTAGDSLTLVNTSDNDITLSAASITVLKLG
jgi:hypothetical protein